MVTKNDLYLLNVTGKVEREKGMKKGLYIAVRGHPEMMHPVPEDVLKNKILLNKMKEQALETFFENKGKVATRITQHAIDVKADDLDEMTKDDLIKLAVKLDIEWSSKDTVADLADKLKEVI